ncbi:DUF4012 domain-containing protein [Candidatus Uhrbacteria bacterium]|nr:DUF4012 domain-containing protein [Candidatus Uhrbacteria bacterium]
MPQPPTLLTATPLPPKRKSPHRAGRLILLGLLVLIVWISTTLVFALLAARAAFAGRDALLAARGEIESMQFSAAADSLKRSGDQFRVAQSRLAFITPWDHLPYTGDQLMAIKGLVEGGVQVADVLSSLVGLGEDLLALSDLSKERLLELQQAGEIPHAYATLSLDTKAALLRRLEAASPELLLLSTKLDLIGRSLQQQVSNQAVATLLADVLRPVRAQVGELSERLRGLSAFARVVPSLLGTDKDSHLMVLFLNNDELRPGGGFLGTFAQATLRVGELKEIAAHDSYSLDTPAGGAGAVILPPPVPLERYNNTHGWFLRDANWSPDFPTSTQQVLRLYKHERGQLPPEAQEEWPSEEPDFVFGMTPDVASALLTATGPLMIRDTRITSENISEVLQYESQVGFADRGIPFEQRKTILLELVPKMLERLQALPLSSVRNVLSLLQDQADHRQLMAWARQPSIQDTFTRLGWAGEMSAQGDVQMVVDANLASLKTDPVVLRAIRYEISKNTDGKYVGRTTIRYAHTGSFDYKTTRYRTYVQLYLPSGSELIRATGLLRDDRINDPDGHPGEVDVKTDGGFTALGGFTSIEPSQTREITFDYLLAPSVVSLIDAGTYRLNVIKQLGADDRALTLHLDFGKTLTRASPSEERDHWGDTIYDWSGVLEGKSAFEVGL